MRSLDSFYTDQTSQVMLRVTLTFLLCLCLYSPPVLAEGTYIVIDAVSENTEDRQPTWIALSARRSGKFLHLPAAQGLHRLRHTRFVYLAHVDFTEHSYSLTGKPQYLTRQRFYRLPLIEDRINYIGRIKVSPDGNHEHTIEWSEELLLQACESNPELFNTTPVVGRQSEMYVSCLDGQLTMSVK